MARDKTLGLVLAAVLVAVPTLAAEPPTVSDADAQKTTVLALRNVGKAIFSWLTDQPEIRQVSGTEKATGENPTTLAVADYAPISVDEVRKLLVPTYIAELPTTDGWGHALEFRINRKALGGAQVMLLRAAGKDGKFDGEVYPIGSFPLGAFERDLVWADGYFVTWPAK
jgi:hypothetical protein